MTCAFSSRMYAAWPGVSLCWVWMIYRWSMTRNGIAQLFEPMSEASHWKPAGERAPRLKKGGLRAASWLTIFTVQGHQRAHPTRKARWGSARNRGRLRAAFCFGQ